MCAILQLVGLKQTLYQLQTILGGATHYVSTVTEQQTPAQYKTVIQARAWVRCPRVRGYPNWRSKCCPHGVPRAASAQSRRVV